MNQKGFNSIIILIALAIIFVIGAITYGYFVTTSKPATKSETQNPAKVELTKQDPLQSKVGTPECPELDYTGCDTSGNFMTWEDNE